MIDAFKSILNNINDIHISIHNSDLLLMICRQDKHGQILHYHSILLGDFFCLVEVPHFNISLLFF